MYQFFGNGQKLLQKKTRFRLPMSGFKPFFDEKRGLLLKNFFSALKTFWKNELVESYMQMTKFHIDYEGNKYQKRCLLQFIRKKRLGKSWEIVFFSANRGLLL